MANYTNERARYGGCAGQILVHSTPGLGLVNDPTATNFKNIIPAGYLRCDGSIYNARDYRHLSEILGVGTDTRFAKEGAIIRDPDLGTGDLGQFQLPDLGSKVIIGGRGTGLYRNTTIERELAGAPITNRVGPQVEIVSNFGSRITSQFVGNMELDSSGPITMLGTPKYNLERSTSETQLNIENFQGHAHNSSQKFLNYTGQHSVATSGGKDSDQRLANSGAGNQLDFSEPWNRESIHKHNITRPTSYAQTFTYSHPTVQIDMSGVSASVDVDVEDDEKLDELVTPFMLVEYIIKF
jgi:hypothetical protein